LIIYFIGSTHQGVDARELEINPSIIVIHKKQDAFSRKDTQITQPKCNIIDPEYNHIDNQVVFVTKANKKEPKKQVWITHINPMTGRFRGECAREILLDQNEISTKPSSSPLGNGPEWGNTRNESSLFYMKQDAMGMSYIAHAKKINEDKWQISKVPNSENKILPIPSNNLKEDDQKILYLIKNKNNDYFTLGWRSLSIDQDYFISLSVPIDNGGARWVPKKNQVSFALYDEKGKTQAALYDLESNIIFQVSAYSNGEVVDEVWSLNAPELDGEQIVWCIINSKEIHVYKKNDSHWTLVRKILFRNQDYPYILSPEPVIFNNKTYLFFQQSTYPKQKDLFNYSQISIIELFGHRYRMLTNPNEKIIRRDPEWVIREDQLGHRYLFIYYTKINYMKNKYNFRSIRSLRTGLHD
jgi:hypothetical protein